MIEVVDVCLDVALSFVFFGPVVLLLFVTVEFDRCWSVFFMNATTNNIYVYMYWKIKYIKLFE